MKVYLPATQRIEDFLGTLEDVVGPGTIKTRAVIEIECSDKAMATFLEKIEPGENGNGAAKKTRAKRKTKTGSDDLTGVQHD